MSLSPFEYVPNDVTRMILSPTYNDYPTLMSLRFVCKHFLHLCIFEKTKDRCLLVSQAFRCGYLSLARWAIDRGAPFDVRATLDSAAHGYVDDTFALMKKNCLWSYNVLVYFLQWSSTMEPLEWVYSLIGTYDPDVCEYNDSYHRAGMRGPPKTQEHFFYSTSLCETAVIYGRLDVLKWLRSKGCKWNANVLIWSIRENDFDTFRWAYENGAPTASSVVIQMEMAKFGRLAFLKYMSAYENIFVTAVSQKAVKHDQIEIIHWLDSFNS